MLTDTTHKTARNARHVIMLRRSSTRNAAAENLDEYECSICVELLYEPYTGPCGHSFCRRCAGAAPRPALPDVSRELARRPREPPGVVGFGHGDPAYRAG